MPSGREQHVLNLIITGFPVLRARYVKQHLNYPFLACRYHNIENGCAVAHTAESGAGRAADGLQKKDAP